MFSSIFIKIDLTSKLKKMTNNAIFDELYNNLWNNVQKKLETNEKLKESESSESYYERALLLGNIQGVTECLELLTLINTTLKPENHEINTFK